MYIFTLKDIGFGNPIIDEVTVMGHFLYAPCTSFYNGTVSHKDNWINIDTRYQDHEAEMGRIKELGLYEFIAHLRKSIMPLRGKWGDDEQDYQDASTSGKWQLRKMVALNGRYLKNLSKDANHKVRVAVIATIGQRIALKGAAKDMNIDYLDEMISDESLEVRRALAKLGITKHLKVLLQDNDARVANEAITYTSPKQLDLLSKSLPEHVRFNITRNKQTTLAQLEVLSKNAESTVQYAIARRGVVTKDLINNENAGVRAMVAKFGALDTVAALVRTGWGVNDSDWRVRQEVANRGFGHSLLYHDAEKVVRLAVAENASGSILNQLVNDISNAVAGAANRRLRGERKIPNQHTAIGQNNFYENQTAL